VTDPDVYSTLADGPPCEIRVKGSRFLAQAWRMRSEADLVSRLESRSRRFHDARHHCWGLRLGPPESLLERCDDDGEPSGTAGVPILGALQRLDLYDSGVIVTRYFGGTKLGTGGLVRAYGDAAAAALGAAPRRCAWLLTVLELSCAYEDLGTVEAVLAQHGDVVHGIERRYEPGPRLHVTVRRSCAPALRAALVEATAGRVVASLRRDGGGGDRPGAQLP
jgi:uncharacterized YigZ family protein